MKILLVDYDSARVQYLEELFQNENAEVMALLAEHETCATTIMEMTRTQRFDAVFIDPLTPSLSPVELPGRIRMISPHTKVILMSTPCPPTIREQLRSQGVVSEFFVEPAVLQELREALGIHPGDTEVCD